MKDRVFVTSAVVLLGFVIIAVAQQPGNYSSGNQVGKTPASRSRHDHYQENTSSAAQRSPKSNRTLSSEANFGTSATNATAPSFDSLVAPPKASSKSKRRSHLVQASATKRKSASTSLDLSDQKQLLSAYVETSKELAAAQAKLEAQEAISKLTAENAELRTQLTTKMLATEFQSLLKKSLNENTSLRERLTKLENAIRTQSMRVNAPAAAYGLAPSGTANRAYGASAGYQQAGHDPYATKPPRPTTAPAVRAQPKTPPKKLPKANYGQPVPKG